MTSARYVCDYNKGLLHALLKLYQYCCPGGRHVGERAAHSP